MNAAEITFLVISCLILLNTLVQLVRTFTLDSRVCNDLIGLSATVLSSSLTMFLQRVYLLLVVATASYLVYLVSS